MTKIIIHNGSHELSFVKKIGNSSGCFESCEIYDGAFCGNSCDFSCFLFCQKAPSNKLDTVPNAPFSYDE